MKKHRLKLFFIISLLFGFLALGLAGKFSSTIAADRFLSPTIKEALYWIGLGESKIQCQLCPRRCVLTPNQKGFCRGRKNIDGKLYTLNYAQPVALHVDPIEKKPLAHVYPGTKSFSIATAGCNLRCKFCQNWEISQLDPESVKVEPVPPKKIVDMTKETGSKTIAFTYTEPIIFYEYMLDIAKIAKAEGIKCVIHSAGFVNEKPLREIAKYLTAANIDLKGFSDKYYASMCRGNVNTVLNTLKILKEEGVWLEITNLLIPGANDSDEDIAKLCEWIKENLGPETPIHFARFFPLYKLTNLSPTPLATLLRAKKIAEREGMKHIYIGNVPQQIGENTICPNCSKTIIKRIGYNVIENLLENGKCSFCGHKIPGIWN
ncbi:MAG: AmmeMemoRadiSam system radical SAM enzyme [Candidatus Omnitrophica bacterium]|nr:AmmeMemoRadiSam system radical SAM enzyme [Candidatus Omnitrophota bacterium]